jgi:hypothetical protein
MRVQILQGVDVVDEAPGLMVDAGLVLVFASRSTLIGSTIVGRVRHAFAGAVICGCSTGGQIAGYELLDEDAVVMALRFDHSQVRLALEDLSGPGSSRACGEALGSALSRPDLAGVLVFADGLCVNGNELVEGLATTIGEDVVIAGGMAADGEAFASTVIVADGTVASGLAAAIGFYGPAFRMHTGIGSGWQVFGPRRRVTRADGNRVYELDGEPILDLYRRYLDDEDFAGLPRAGLLFPLQISSGEAPEQTAIRAVLGIDRDERAMIFGGDIPVGSIAQLMRRTSDRLVDGAAEAATRALDGSPIVDLSATAAILVSRIGRRLPMESRIEAEIASVDDVLAEIPRTGIYSLGEISPFRGTRRPGLHDETMTVITLAEEA